MELKIDKINLKQACNLIALNSVLQEELTQPLKKDEELYVKIQDGSQK